MGQRKLNFSKLLEPEEQNELLKAPNAKIESGFRDYCILLFMLNSGLRVSETVRLKPKDIDWKRGYIKVIGGKGKQTDKDGNKLSEEEAGKDRVVPIDYPILATLKEWDKRRPKFGETFFCALRGEDRGRPMTTRNLRKLINRYASKAKLKHVHPHMLRHTYATNLVEKGVPLEVIKELLGHEDLKTTSIYAQFRPTMLAKFIQTSPPSH